MISMQYDYIILGGGFYGCMIAQSLKGKILLLEKEDDILKRASCNNQARVHNGYHYPRNLKTASSSHRNYPKFIADFPEACNETNIMLYCVAKGGKTNAKDFKRTYELVGSILFPAPKELKDHFNMDLLEEVFIGEEAVFNADIIRETLRERLKDIEIRTKVEVQQVFLNQVRTNIGDFEANHIISCLYSGTNPLLVRSNLPTLPLIHEDTVMPLIKVPEPFNKIGITIMDGEYFSIMPFPQKDCHSIHHVTYTPLGGDWKTIYEDVIRFIPAMKDMKHIGDVKEAKTILEANATDDGRPILMKQNYGFKGFSVIVGAKLDNVYDLLEPTSEANITT